MRIGTETTDNCKQLVILFITGGTFIMCGTVEVTQQNMSSEDWMICCIFHVNKPHKKTTQLIPQANAILNARPFVFATEHSLFCTDY